MKKLLFIILSLFIPLLFSCPSFAETPSDDITELIEEIINTPSSERLEPLGVTENNQKVEEQKKSNNLISIVCMIVMALSGIGVILIILHPLLHHRKKKNLIKF